MRAIEFLKAFDGETQVTICRSLGVEKTNVYEGKINDIPFKLFDELGFFVEAAIIDNNVLNLITKIII